MLRAQHEAMGMPCAQREEMGMPHAQHTALTYPTFQPQKTGVFCAEHLGMPWSETKTNPCRTLTSFQKGRAVMSRMEMPYWHLQVALPQALPRPWGVGWDCDLNWAGLGGRPYCNPAGAACHHLWLQTPEELGTNSAVCLQEQHGHQQIVLKEAPRCHEQGFCPLSQGSCSVHSGRH